MNPTARAGERPEDLGIRRIRPAYEQVADQLRDLVIGGSIGPGDRLPAEADLATKFGVSRSTIREALRVLGSEGLFRTTRGVSGGTFVAETDPGAVSDYLETRLGLLSGHEAITVAELLEARQLLEVPAARLAAERRSEEQLEEMRLSIERERAESERGPRFEHHHHFHVALLSAAQNRLLDMMTVPVFRVIRARFLGDRPNSSFWQDVDHDHDTILERIEAGDADGAAGAMAEHLERLRAVYEAAAAQQSTA